MNTINRNSEGRVTSEDGAVDFTVPTDCSMLSVLGIEENARNLAPGDDFREDGWVYDGDGNRKRKWFTTISNRNGGYDVRLWRPKLKDLSELERLRWRLIERIRNVILPQWDTVRDALRAAGGGHLQAWTTWGDKRVQMWREYTVREDGSVSWDWLEPDQVPECVRNQEFVTAYDLSEKRVRQYFTYLGKVEEVLFHAIESRLGWPEKDEAGKRVRLIVNGREYWMFAQYNRWAVPVWQKLSWPEVHSLDETIEV